MKCIEIQNKSLVPTERPKPVPQQGELLIKVMAAGVNRPDILQRQGLYPPPEGASDLPGLEVAGIIESDGGTRFKKGDKVCALLTGGGYAEYAVAPEVQCLPVPQNFSFEQAASLPECLFTLWNTLILRGKLSEGESVLIHGGTSGIGSFGIQLAKSLGASDVFATAGNTEKCEAIAGLGGRPINYNMQDFEEEIIAVTQSEGVDVIIDMVGGAYLEKHIRLLKKKGRHVSIAFLGGKQGSVNIQDIMRKQLALTGATLRAEPTTHKFLLAQALEEKVWPLLKAGEIIPVLDEVYPLNLAWKAHVRMESSKHIGKIILSVTD